MVYLSTCNRVEFYTTAKDHFQDTRSLWLACLAQFGLTEEDYYKGYHVEGKSAVRHLMRVASSLESLVIGEPQILGQLKEALNWTKEQGFPVDPSLEKTFNIAFETAKRVRSTTSIGEKPVSVATLGLQHLHEWRTFTRSPARWSSGGVLSALSPPLGSERTGPIARFSGSIALSKL